MKIGSRIRDLRKAKKLTHSQLAQLTNTTQQTISNYENDKSEPNLDMLNSICNALGITLSEFFSFGDAQTLPTDLKLHLRAQVLQIQKLHSAQINLTKKFFKDITLINNEINKEINSTLEGTSLIEILDLIDRKGTTLTIAGKPISLMERIKILESLKEILAPDEEMLSEYDDALVASYQGDHLIHIPTSEEAEDIRKALEFAREQKKKRQEE